ncbi:hypothetical protein [Hymenobacter jejuensis]|uniref:Uncharacterized protein n=1 Tax=Hymenobacter jejuensis TaxID=2502781 RepID=A0A5B7ZVR8_9BACT|nr:hypothetical protein [Hymenobacter jejuensis]QDA59324.1 hypothetical protein FHG12_04040 [Hymenobacter jejuensis]
MELHELRRRWQQQPASSQIIEQQELDAILARQSDGIIERLRRSARLELYLNFGVLLVSLALAWLAQPFWVRMLGWVLVVVGGVCIVYLWRKLHLLRRMDDPAGDLRAHLLRLASGLRALICFYFRFTLAMLPVTGFVQVLMVASTAKRDISLTTLPGLALVVGLVVVLPALLYLPVASVTRLYLQRLYGQHLDRLEECLRELQSS